MGIYKITDLQGNDFQIEANHPHQFINEFEKHTGKSFSCIDLIWKDVRITESLKVFSEYFVDATETTMIVSDTPIRLLDKDLYVMMINSENGFWNTYSVFLEKVWSGRRVGYIIYYKYVLLVLW